MSKLKWISQIIQLVDFCSNNVSVFSETSWTWLFVIFTVCDWSVSCHSELSLVDAQEPSNLNIIKITTLCLSSHPSAFPTQRSWRAPNLRFTTSTTYLFLYSGKLQLHTTTLDLIFYRQIYRSRNTLLIDWLIDWLILTANGIW